MMVSAGSTVYQNALKSAASGFLFFLALPAAAILAFVSVIGIPVGLLLTFGCIILLLLATPISSVVLANWINNRRESSKNSLHLVLTAFGIFVVLKLVSFTPFFGWLIMLLVACIAIGAIILNVQTKTRMNRMAAD